METFQTLIVATFGFRAAIFTELRAPQIQTENTAQTLTMYTVRHSGVFSVVTCGGCDRVCGFLCMCTLPTADRTKGTERHLAAPPGLDLVREMRERIFGTTLGYLC